QLELAALDLLRVGVVDVGDRLAVDDRGDVGAEGLEAKVVPLVRRLDRVALSGRREPGPVRESAKLELVSLRQDPQRVAGAAAVADREAEVRLRAQLLRSLLAELHPGVDRVIGLRAIGLDR